MNEQEVRDAILDALRSVAPEADPGTLAGDELIQDQLDIDSMDFLNFVVGVHERTGVDVPERDYRRMATLDGAVAFVVGQLPA
jgi:acyl carrier protein